MKRRNTIDCFYATSWPVCQYYYTHNTGSCDDILLNRVHPTRNLLISNTTTQNSSGVRKSIRVRKKRRYTYPVVLLNQTAYTRQFLENNNTKAPGLVLRRWSTISQEIKRQTLVNITSTNKIVTNEDDISDNNKDCRVRSMILETELPQSHRSINYKTQLQNEKLLSNQLQQTKVPLLRVINSDKEEVENEKVKEPTSPATAVLHTEATISTTLMDSGVNINSSLIAHPPSVSLNSTEQSNNRSIDPNGNENNNTHSSSNTVSSDEDSVAIFMPSDSNQNNSNSSIDMFLFLFGFLFFPLWWVGAWKYIMQNQAKSVINSKGHEVFQILNCCMSLASLILLGLIIGLVTVWT